MSSPAVFEKIDNIYIINLPARADRRLEMAEQLSLVDLDMEHAKITLFPAVRPEDPGQFPSIGARGCFMSHLGVLKDAENKGHNNILILEDDANFTSDFLNSHEKASAILDESDWDILYFGYDIGGATPGNDDKNCHFLHLAPSMGVGLTHALIIRQQTIEKIILYFEAMAARPGGDPMGGPMHVDGAYSWFRKDNPDIKTIATKAQWVNQRASKTDIHETTWRENIPFIKLARRMRNKMNS